MNSLQTAVSPDLNYAARHPSTSSSASILAFRRSTEGELNEISQADDVSQGGTVNHSALIVRIALSEIDQHLSAYMSILPLA